MLDRKRINDELDKHLEKLSLSTSRNKGFAMAVPSTSAAVGKHIGTRDNRSSSVLTASKNKLFNGTLFRRQRLRQLGVELTVTLSKS